MISTADIYIAYRKLKGQTYYENTNLLQRLRIAEWETEFVRNNIDCNADEFQARFKDKVQFVEYFVNDDSFSIEQLKAFLPEKCYRLEVKSFEPINEYKGKGKFITNAPSGSMKVDKCNFQIDAPVEIHLFSILWCMFLNKYLNRSKLRQYNYANHLRKDTIAGNPTRYDNPVEIGLGVNYVYFYGYRKWRDNALAKAEELLKGNKNATILSLDIKRYFYSVRLNVTEILSRACDLNYIDTNYKNDNDFKRLTSIIQSINDIYAERTKHLLDATDVHNGLTYLPVGLHSSGVLGNLYLLDFDEKVSTLQNCCYYGRYVDDMLFVFSGKLDSRSSDQINTFINSKFIKQHILNSDAEDSYYLETKPNLKIQQSKIVLESFNSKGSRAALTLFKKKLIEQCSDFRFIVDDVEEDDEFENAAYNLNISDSANKIRNIDAFK